MLERIKIFRFLHIFNLITFACFFAFLTYAQNLTVKGSVISAEDGQPIPGVNIRIDGTEMGSSTNFDGFYSIEVPENSNLIFSYIGMQETKITVTQSTHNVVMEVNTTGLDEVVVVGYGTMKKESLLELFLL